MVYQLLVLIAYEYSTHLVILNPKDRETFLHLHCSNWQNFHMHMKTQMSIYFRFHGILVQVYYGNICVSLRL